jgi:hypothetical protein
MVQQDQINKNRLANIEFRTRFNSDMRDQVSANPAKIQTNIDNINSLFSDMSGNNTRYDFTTKDDNGNPILFSLKDDRTMTAALIKDNATYLAEQNNLYVVGTLTMATLLVAAILISK